MPRAEPAWKSRRKAQARGMTVLLCSHWPSTLYFLCCYFYWYCCYCECRMAAEVMTGCLVGEQVSQSCPETAVTQQLFVCAAGEKGELLGQVWGKVTCLCMSDTWDGFYCWHVAAWTAVFCVCAVICLGCLETLMWKKMCEQGWPLVPSPYLEYTGHKESLFCSSGNPYLVITQAICWYK